MTPLAEILRRRIAAEGPMTVAEYMGLCLMHPQHGYYTTRDPLGATAFEVLLRRLVVARERHARQWTYVL